MYIAVLNVLVQLIIVFNESMNVSAVDQLRNCAVSIEACKLVWQKKKKKGLAVNA